MRFSLYEDPDLLQLYFNDVFDPNWQSPPSESDSAIAWTPASATAIPAPVSETTPPSDGPAEVATAEEEANGFRKASVLVVPTDGPSRGGGSIRAGLGREGSGVTAAIARDPPVEWKSTKDREAYVPRYRALTAFEERRNLIQPRTKCVVARYSSAKRQVYLECLEWGLRRSWSKGEWGSPPINARADHIRSDQGMWKGLRTGNRCVVLAQGFYEWPETGRSSKSPTYSKLKNGSLMVMAGLWDHPAAGQEADTFAIVTVESNARLLAHHERMPLILGAPKNVRAWLQDEGWSPKLDAMMRPYVGELDSYKVTSNINNIHADLPTFVEPLAERKGTIHQLFAAQSKQQPTTSSSPLRPSTHANSSPKSPSTPAKLTSFTTTAPAKSSPTISSMFANATKRPPPVAESSESDLEILTQPTSAKKAKTVVDLDDDEVEVVEVGAAGAVEKENVGIQQRVG